MTFDEFHKIRLKYVWEKLDGNNRKEVEKDVQRKIEQYFSQWFTVYTEVKSDCGKKRCDILMYHKEFGSPQVPFIIEIKRDDVKQGNTLADWCKQASNYSNLLWHKGKKPIVVLFPQISGLYFEEGCLVKPHDVVNNDHHNINSFLYGAFGIGELRDFYYHNKKGYAIILNNKIIWQSAFPFELHSKRIPHGYLNLL